MTPLRRLPVLQNSSTSDDGRPAWHWVPIGFLFVVSLWLPFAMVANWAAGRVVHRILGDLPANEIGLRLADADASDRFSLWMVLTAAPLVAFSAACGFGGALVGRFGGQAGPKEAAASGALAGLAGTVLTLATGNVFSFASSALFLVLVPLGAGAAWLGGRWGFRRKVASSTRPPPPPAR